MVKKESEYHSWLKRILTDFSEEIKDKMESCCPSLKLTSGKFRCKDVVEYTPDYVFKFKTGKKSFEYIIFEILDTQSYEGVIADIIECLCIENCRLLIFLSRTEEEHKMAIRHRNIVCDFLDSLKGENLLDVVNLHIPREMPEEDIKDLIHGEINRRVKLPRPSMKFDMSRFGGRARLG